MADRVPRQFRVPLPFLYGRGTRRILRSVVAVLCPHDGMFNKDIDTWVTHAMLSFVPFLAAAARYSLPAGLALIEYCPVLFGYGAHRFSTLSREQAGHYLEHLQEGGAGPLSLLIFGLRSLILMSFYQNPQILAALEVDWQARADELTRRRAGLLAGDVSQAGLAEENT